MTPAAKLAAEALRLTNIAIHNDPVYEGTWKRNAKALAALEAEQSKIVYADMSDNVEVGGGLTLGDIRNELSVEQSPVPEDRERLAKMLEARAVFERIDDPDDPADEPFARVLDGAAAALRQQVPLKPVAAEVETLWREHAEWSEATFGTSAERGPLGPLRHLEKEVREAQAATNDIIEYADCLMLVMDAARRAGFSLAELLDAWRRKLAINKARVWPKTSADEAVEHRRLSPPTEQSPFCSYPNCDCAVSFPKGHKVSKATECPKEQSIPKEDWKALAVDLRKELGLPPDADRHEITVAVRNAKRTAVPVDQERLAYRLKPVVMFLKSNHYHHSADIVHEAIAVLRQHVAAEVYQERLAKELSAVASGLDYIGARCVNRPASEPVREAAVLLRHLSPLGGAEWRPTEEQIKHMVDRFLNWKLPENFNPDGGISFKAAFNEHTTHPMKHEPSGTNLFDAVQADAMVRYMIEGMPALPSPKDGGA